MQTSTLRLAVLALVGLIAPGALDGQEPKVDRYGDPLPAGAIARLGTERWRHGDGTVLVAFLPGGKALLSVGYDGSVRQWDVATGKETPRFTLPGHLMAGIEEMKFPGNPRWHSELDHPRSIALGADGKVLALTQGGSAVHLWDVAAGKELHKIYVAGAGPLGIALTADSKTLAAQDADGTVRLFDVATGKEIGRFGKQVDKRNPLYNAWVTISADGKRLAATSTNRSETADLRLWDTDTGKELSHQTFKENWLDPGQVEFSPDGKWLAAVLGKRIVLADAVSGKEVHRLTHPKKNGRFPGFLFAPDSKTFFVWRSSNMDDFYSFEIATGKQLREFPRLPSEWWADKNTFRLAAISPDGNRLALGGARGHICLLEMARGGGPPDPEAHILPVTHLSISPDGKRVFTTDLGWNIGVWDAATGKRLRRIQRSQHPASERLLSNDGQLLLTIGGDVYLEDVATGRDLWENRRDGLPAAISANNKVLALTAMSEKETAIHVYEIPSGKRCCRLALPSEVSSRPQRLLFAPDDRILAASLEDGKVRLWNTATGRELPMLDSSQDRVIWALAFSQDGRSLVVDRRDNAPCLYETTTGRQRRRYRTGQAVDVEPKVEYPGAGTLGAVALSRDGRLLANSKRGGSITLWDVARQKELGQLKGHQADVTALTFSGDGKSLASGSRDTTVLLWDVSAFTAKAKPEAVAIDAPARWQDLMSDDAAKAFDAIYALAAAPDKAVPYLKEHARPAMTADAATVKKLIADLDSEQFDVRKRANDELKRLGEAVVPLVRKALEADVSPEGRKRLEALLAKEPWRVPTGETLRSLRAIEVLEMIGTAEAQSVLEKLAEGTAGAAVTQAAKETLQRMKR